MSLIIPKFEKWTSIVRSGRTRIWKTGTLISKIQLEISFLRFAYRIPVFVILVGAFLMYDGKTTTKSITELSLAILISYRRSSRGGEEAKIVEIKKELRNWNKGSRKKRNWMKLRKWKLYWMENICKKKKKDKKLQRRRKKRIYFSEI